MRAEYGYSWSLPHVASARFEDSCETSSVPPPSPDPCSTRLFSLKVTITRDSDMILQLRSRLTEDIDAPGQARIDRTLLGLLRRASLELRHLLLGELDVLEVGNDPRGGDALGLRSSINPGSLRGETGRTRTTTPRSRCQEMRILAGLTLCFLAMAWTWEWR